MDVNVGKLTIATYKGAHFDYGHHTTVNVRIYPNECRGAR